ncbi:portal protein [Pyruvatibacter mobilis]|uniref:portal protein n=1 Tax=Pyruvatibacter mobilis TaxID=1712261 RepID=UPI003BA85283
MKLKTKRMTDEEIVADVQNGLRDATEYDSSLASERAKALDYYEGKLPKPLHKGNSKYVSMDVYDAVETMKAQLLEVFAGTARPLKFLPEGPEDMVLARQATEATRHVIHRQNDAFHEFGTVIHDGLMNRNGIIKVYFDTTKETIKEDYSGLTPDEAIFILADEDIESLISEEVAEDGTVDLTVERCVVKPQVRIVCVPIEEFLISTRAVSLSTARIVAHRYNTTRTDLINEGYPVDKVNSIDTDRDFRTDDTPEGLARHEDTSDRISLTGEEGEGALQEVTVYEAYLRMDVDGTGVASYWKVTYSGGVLLDKEEVDCHPFLDFCPLPMPHRFWGNNYAEKVFPTQNARTLLTRSIVDHALITNNPRWQVLKSGLVNYKEMTDNRLGGIVNVKRPDAISPLPQTGLNPFVFQTIQLLDEDKEETTGISRLSQGLNKDAISKQNSKDMVDGLISNSQQRQKIIARNFAENFLKKLYLRVYQLLIENQQDDLLVDVAGEHVQITPGAWKERRDIKVEFSLGYGEQEKEAQRLQLFYQTLASDPALSPRFGTTQRAELLDEIGERMGVPMPSRFLVKPEEVPKPQPSPAEQLDMQMRLEEMAIKKRQEDRADRKQAFAEFMEQQRYSLTELETTADIAQGADENDRKDRELQHKKFVDTEELRQLPLADETRGIVSPTG